MAISLGATLTGAVMTGSSAPVYSMVVDNPPNASTGKQWNVSGLSSGTFASLRFHSISDPMTITFERPGVMKTLVGLISGITGLYGKVPDNVYSCRVRKGVNIAANNLPRIMEIYARFSVPAGADAYDAPNVRGAMSLFAGAMTAVGPGYGDTLVTGTQ